MKVWLIKIGEPLPLHPNVRKLRTGMLADNLVSRGHEVRWWTSGFDHNRKMRLFPSDTEVHLSQELTLHILRGCGYSSNISLARYLDHRVIARKFHKQAVSLEPPDVVVASMPCHHLAFEAVRYARLRNIPVLVDVRDLWPDIFLTKFKNPVLKRLGRVILTSDFHRLYLLLKEANGLLAVSRGYLDWALEKIGRSEGKWDRVFYLGYRAVSENGPPAGSLLRFPWLKGHENKKLLLFIGSFGFSYELSLLVQAARRLSSAGRDDVCFVLAGAGEQDEMIRKESVELPNVLFPGWIGAKEIEEILLCGFLGLLPYIEGAPQSLPNKPFEYLSAGLPLVSSLEGEMAGLINNHGLGLNYRAGDLDGLCRALQTLLDDSFLRERMSANALAFFQTHGDADKIYREYSEHIESLAEAGRLADDGGGRRSRNG